MNVSLTPELDKYVQSKVETGRYNSASEVLREALRLMQEKDEIRELQLAQVRRQIDRGMDALASGDIVEGTASELYQQSIERSRRRLEARKRSSDGSNV